MPEEKAEKKGKTEQIVIYPGIPTGEEIDVAWQKKHNPAWPSYAKAFPELVPDKPADEGKTGGKP